MANIVVSSVRQTITDKLTQVEVFCGARAKKGEDGKKIAIASNQKVRSIIIAPPDVSGVPSKFSVFVSCWIWRGRNSTRCGLLMRTSRKSKKACFLLMAC